MDIPPRTVFATVENTSTRKRAEESSRKFVLVSFPVYGNADLINLIETNVRGNPLSLTFGEPNQASLPIAEATEDVETSVDGQPSKITRRKVTNQTRERLAALQEAGKKNHAFISGTEDEFCTRCSQPSESGVHVIPTWTERYEHYLSDPESSGHQEPQNAGDLASDDTSNGYAQQLTEAEATFYESLTDPMSDTARALIEESRRTPATEAEAQEQRDAEAALAARSL